MPRNVEIKARVTSFEDFKAKARALACDGDHPEGLAMEQRDVFFNVPAEKGRLKLRSCTGKKTQLIFYQRDDQTGPKMSNFKITDVDDGDHEPVDSLEDILCLAIGKRGEVRKTRHLFLVGQTRIHCDRVHGLGDFMELEVMLESHQTLADGEAIAKDLMEKLGVDQSDLISCAYMDMLESKQKSEPQSNKVEEA